MRTIVFWPLYWGPPILGKYHLVPLAVPEGRAAVAALLPSAAPARF